MKRAQLKKQSSGAVLMTIQNLKICAGNQEGFETLYLNDSLQLQHYNFSKIQNLQQCIHIESEDTQGNNCEKSTQVKNVQGVNTLFLNNNLIQKIQNLQTLSRTLVTLNISHNKIRQFEGLSRLVNLSVLDVSYNLIDFIHQDQISPLQRLTRLNLNSNKFTSKQSVQGICAISESLETLELNNNQNFRPEPQFLSEVLSKMSKLKVLMLKDTPFIRMTPSYRKQVILSVYTLTFLDERPVTQDERFLALAWKKGGLKQEQEARKTIKQQKQQKNVDILKQIQDRNKIIHAKVQKVFNLKAKELLSQLQTIRAKLKGEESELLTSDEESLIRLKIQELEKYLELLKEQCRSMDLDHELGIKKLQLPKMIVQNRTSDCIYIYHVDESQLPLIKEKYYAQQTLPLKAVNYEQKQQLEWLEEYDTILCRLYTICKGNWEMILPSFNLEIYDFDLNCGRKLRRFSEEYVRKKFESFQSKSVNSKEQESLEQSNTNSQNQRNNHLDSLD